MLGSSRAQVLKQIDFDFIDILRCVGLLASPSIETARASRLRITKAKLGSSRAQVLKQKK